MAHHSPSGRMPPNKIVTQLCDRKPYGHYGNLPFSLAKFKSLDRAALPRSSAYLILLTVLTHCQCMPDLRNVFHQTSSKLSTDGHGFGCLRPHQCRISRRLGVKRFPGQCSPCRKRDRAGAPKNAGVANVLPSAQKPTHIGRGCRQQCHRSPLRPTCKRPHLSGLTSCSRRKHPDYWSELSSNLLANKFISISGGWWI